MPRYQSPILSGALASRVYIQDKLEHRAPTAVAISEGYDYFGGSSGYSIGKLSSASRAAIGEFLERTYFTQLNLEHTRSTIANLDCPEEYRISLRSCLQQLCARDKDNDLEAHEFSWLRTVELNSGENRYFPFCLVSMANVQANRHDRTMLTWVDSSGSAIHVTPDAAIESALFEFIERQTLLLTWYTGYARFRIVNLDYNLTPEGAYAMAKLSAMGEVFCFEVSPFDAVSSVVCLFRGRGVKSGYKYSIGCSCNKDASIACSKALLEAYQTLELHSYQEALSRLSKDRLVRAYCSANSADTLELFRCMNVRTEVSLSAHVVSGERTQLLHQLGSVSNHISVFVDSFALEKTIYTVAKVQSPDFFIGIGTVTHNHSNAFSNKFSNGKPLHHIGIQMPFP